MCQYPVSETVVENVLIHVSETVQTTVLEAAYRLVREVVMEGVHHVNIHVWWG